jgi:hypothetical protein
MKPLLTKMSMLNADSGLAPYLSRDIMPDDETCILKTILSSSDEDSPGSLGKS